MTNKLNKVMIISFMVGFIIGLWGYFQLELRAQPTDPRKEELLKQSPNGNEWPSQILYDTVNACYQGTYKWIVMNNPSLIGTLPPPPTQRTMLEHCFCVLDKIRTKFKYKAYVDYIQSDSKTAPVIIPRLFMEKAIECIRDFGTLGGLVILDEETIKGYKDYVGSNDNETETIGGYKLSKEKNQKEEPDNGSGESDSIPEQPNEPIEEEVPQINF